MNKAAKSLGKLYLTLIVTGSALMMVGLSLFVASILPFAYALLVIIIGAAISLASTMYEPS